jgi:hypothetical protein
MKKLIETTPEYQQDLNPQVVTSLNTQLNFELKMLGYTDEQINSLYFYGIEGLSGTTSWQHYIDKINWLGTTAGGGLTGIVSDMYYGIEDSYGSALSIIGLYESELLHPAVYGRERGVEIVPAIIGVTAAYYSPMTIVKNNPQPRDGYLHSGYTGSTAGQLFARINIIDPGEGFFGYGPGGYAQGVTISIDSLDLTGIDENGQAQTLTFGIPITFVTQYVNTNSVYGIYKMVTNRGGTDYFASVPVSYTGNPNNISKFMCFFPPDKLGLHMDYPVFD